MTPEKSVSVIPEGSAYAWGKSARLITKDPFFDTLAETHDFTAVDLCSAYPLYAWIMRGQYKTRSREQSAQLIGKVLHIFHRRKEKMNAVFPSLASLSDEEFKLLREELMPREGFPKLLAQSAIYELLYNPPSDLIGEATDEKRDGIKKYLIDKLSHSKKIYSPIREIPRKGTHHGWEFIIERSAGTTFRREIEDLMGPDKSDLFVEELAGHISDELVGTLKGFSIVSLDIASFLKIRRMARLSFPEEFRKTYYYRSASEPGYYIQGDMRTLPIREGSVSFLNCIEGWPFYFTEEGAKQNFEIARSISHILAVGGSAVFFPWRMKDQDVRQQTILDRIVKYWERLGLTVSFVSYTKAQLENIMSDRELVLVNQSPVFEEPVDSLDALILTKPKSAAYASRPAMSHAVIMPRSFSSFFPVSVT